MEGGAGWQGVYLCELVSLGSDFFYCHPDDGRSIPCPSAFHSSNNCGKRLPEQEREESFSITAPAFQSKPHAVKQGVNQFKNTALHSVLYGLRLPNDLHLSSLAVEVYN